MRKIAEDVLRERYYQPGETCFEDICDRVVNHVFPQDKSMRNKCKDMMINFRFLPNSPTLMNSGTDIGQLSACFTLGIDDNMISIFDTLKNAALIFKSGGGVGINFSYLRPKGAPVGSTLGTSSGVLSFMEVFNSMVETVKSGAVRRGAAIGILNCDHPEIEDFIVSKNTEGKLSNFNISVMITDDFMKAVELGSPWYLKFDGRVYKEIDARGLYNKIAESMWTRAEPGILYFDAINKDNMLISKYGLIDSVNPCGEKTLVILRDKDSEFHNGGSSCNLGSLNLTAYVENNQFYFYKFEKDVRTAVRFLDAVIDVNKYPLESIEYVTKDIREIGLGVMGYHDMLIMLGVPYDSEEAIKLERDIFKKLYESAKSESEILASEKGSYPACDIETPRRNSFLIAIAPTGTLALLSNCSSGIEPNFSYVYDRTTTSSGEKKKYREVHPLFESYMKCAHPNRYDVIVEHMMKFGTIQDCSDLNEDDKRLFKTAKDIDWRDHIKVQSAAQKWVDSSISKTVNMPNEATVEDMRSAIMLGWNSGLKGFTVYREGSRNDVVLETNSTKKVDGKKDSAMLLPSIAEGKRIRMKSACGILWVNVIFNGDKPVEVFVTTEGGGCNANTQFNSRMISKYLQETNGDYETVCKQGDKVFCSACVKNKNGDAEGYSCAHLISEAIRTAVALKQSEMGQLERVSRFKPAQVDDKNACPDCGAQLIHTDGCKTCTCGYTACK